jgi:phage gp46-like protein
MSRFSGDPAVKITANGAKIKFIDGQPVMDRGIENATQISLYTKPGWWGNSLIQDINKKVGSEFEKQRVIVEVDTLTDVRNDANNALKWMLDTRLASNIDVEVSNPNLNYIQTYIKIQPPGQDINEFRFFSNGISWINQSLEPAHERFTDEL